MCRYPVRAADAPIGIFDSGVGGLTVARSVLDLVPHEPILYVGDTARGPYGPRPIAEVRAFALDVMDHLVDQARQDARDRVQLRQRRGAAGRA